MQLKIIMFALTVYSFFFEVYAKNSRNLPYPTALIESIAASEKWQRLIKLTPKTASENSNFSIHSQRFYLSELSVLTAKKELIETLNAFHKIDKQLATSENPQCRFPARYHWLKKKFDLSGVNVVQCHDFSSMVKTVIYTIIKFNFCDRLLRESSFLLRPHIIKTKQRQN